MQFLSMAVDRRKWIKLPAELNKSFVFFSISPH
jgi:hypothetical protein